MNAIIGSVRALLRDFSHSSWDQCHARTPTWEVYFSRAVHGVNPMVQASALEPAPERALGPAPAINLTAPHLGLFEPMVEEGATVRQGSTVAQLRVLDRTTPILAEADGAVEFLAEKGGLVEFGGALARVCAG